MWESESESASAREYGSGLLTSTNQRVKTDGIQRRGHSWYVDTDVPSDFLVLIGEVNFHLHKYPLLSRCGKLNRIVNEWRDPDLNKITMEDLPGGAEAFALAAKFCYGIAVELTAGNISGLRCAAEYLEMTEDLEEGNLIFKTEAFLSYVVLSSWRDSIVVLKSCEKLSPWAENLQIVRRCSESIAWKACANPKGIRWAYTGRHPKVTSPKWNGMKDSSPSGNHQVPPDWWFEDVSILRIDHFVRVITAIKVKGMRFELIGAAIMHYGTKWLPGLISDITTAGDESSNYSVSDSSSVGGGGSWKGGLHMIVAGARDDSSSSLQAKDQRMIIESLISIIPPQKDSVSCSFLLRLLNIANMLKVAPALITELEKRVGMQFEQATLADLLIPSYGKSETMYDVDLVQRLLEHFLVQEVTENSSPPRLSFSNKNAAGNINAKTRVARLVDSYLTEVSKDRNLSLTKFQALAEALPESARTCDDGLYRAIDSYLKAHPALSEHERKRLCRIMDCQKLSIDACMHAAQNERLPLRVVVQVLFCEQVKISNALAHTSLGDDMEPHYYQPMIMNRKTLLEGTPQSFQEGWTAAKKDINALKFELESMKAKYLELQNDMENLQKQYDKMVKPKQSSAWSSGWKKLSKLTRLSNAESHDVGQQIPAPPEPNNIKVHRRWRNSIS
ncbi:root phototropism protein 3 [Neltuma alba]|uniref:root phototropism protein 3 n=1 Tax=Neltuma alba TaxID=207710 RepID=UPI0010A4BB18|nr:root phototropism protein 3-like [Prosopis alba]XP_028771661.1 root phototropism protein 3-like [Prosopis alba]XP_028771662.1 root phototropism protein 3-like [Prosopis alba]